MISCYRCNAPAVSVEHVPPKCLFPERADVSGNDLRKNLITVPSCNEHNAGKSDDDEFLMVSLAGVIGNNSVGYRHKFGKVERALRRRSYRLLSKVLLGEHTLHQLPLDNNRFVEVIWGTPDVERLTRCFEHIGYGLHYHHFGRQFSGTLRVHLGFLQHPEGNARTFNAMIRARAEIDLAGQPTLGANPDVFRFIVSEPDSFSTFLMKLHFYGGLEVYVAFIPDGIDLPAHPLNELLKAGIPTTVTLKEQEFSFVPVP